MASKKVLSIEVGSKFTRIAEVDYKVKNPKVYHTLTIDTPEGVSNDGVIKSTPEFVKKVRTKIAKNGMKSKKVIFTIASTKIANREILIPKVKENRIGALVMANASDYFPVDLAEYDLAYFILDTVQDEQGAEKYKIMVLAISKSMVAAYEKFAKECGLTVLAMDYSGNSLYQMVKKECNTGVPMVIKVDGRSTMVTILNDGAMVMQRTIAYGLDPVVECYKKMEAEDFTYHQVLKELSKHSYFDINSTDVGPLYGGESLADLLVEAFAYTLLGISRIYDYYNSRNPQKPINKIYVTGMGAGVNGLTSYLSDRLGLEVHNISMLGEYHFDKKMDKEQANRYIASLGAALAPVGFIEENKEDKKALKAGKGGSLGASSYAVGILTFCVIVSVLLMLIGILPYLKEKGKNQNYYTRVEELRGIIPIYQEYVQTKNADNYLQAAYDETVLPTENLVQFIEEMEEKMPKDMYVTSFSANKEGVAFSVVVNTKQQAADALLQLRSFESLVNVYISDITDTNGEGTAGVVTFSVSADYVDAKTAEINEENAEQNTQETEVWE